MTGVEFLFLLLGAVAVGAALLVVSSRNLVHAALWLVVTLGALAGCYLLLTAELVAWVQVLIYVGAVVVLLLFGLMLTRAPIGYSAEFTSGNRWVAAGVAGATGGVLVTVVGQAFGDAYIDVHAGVAGSSGAMGSAIFRYWVLPFEALSVLLLAALVGAIVLSRGGASDPEASGAGSGGSSSEGAGWGGSRSEGVGSDGPGSGESRSDEPGRVDAGAGEGEN